MAAGRSQRNSLYFRRIWGFGGLYKRKAPKAPPFCAYLGGKRPPRWGGGPAGARGGPSFVFPGSLRRNPLLIASGLMGLEFPAGGAKVDPSPYPPPRGGGWLVGTLRPLPLPRGRLASENRGASAHPSQPPLEKGRWRAAPERFYPPTAALRRAHTPQTPPPRLRTT